MRIVKLVTVALATALATQAWALGGMADVTVFDRSAGKSLKVHWHEGRAWVVGKPGNEYQIMVRNRRGEDLLAVMSVDGVNVVSGETAHPQQSGYVLSPWRGLEVKGWRKSLERTAAFYFTPLPDSYAARTGRPDDVGVIGVALFQRKRAAPPQSVAPLSQSAPAAADSAAARAEAQPLEREAKLGTGHGRSETSLAQVTHFERESEYPTAANTLHYDRRENLIAMGVLPVSTIARMPNPFPSWPPRFTPDPPAH